MKPTHLLLSCVVSGAFCAALAGCAADGNGEVAALTQQRAASLLVLGRTTRDDVRGRLGEALVSRFPSGQEVWFYQYADSPARYVRYVPIVGRMTATGTRVKELKILFGADGRVKKFKLQEIRLQ